MKCLQCKKLTNNPKFCSKSCSAIYNNKIFPKRKKFKHKCKSCENLITERRRKYCSNTCNPNYRDWGKVTLKELKGRYKYQKNSRIRDLARKSISKNTPRRCACCSYDKHVEVCHIKPVSDFPDTTFISEINDNSNLILLCRNCHWELDNDLLDLRLPRI